jgi:hypothetical protein
MINRQISKPPGVFTVPMNRTTPGLAAQQAQNHVIRPAVALGLSEKFPRRKSIGDASTDAGDSDREKEMMAARILSSPMESEDSGSEMECGTVMNGSTDLPSIGSMQHDSGNCLRCCFFPKGRCQNGYDCKFCHFDHEKRQRKTTKKSTKVSGLPRSDSRDAQNMVASSKDFNGLLAPPPGLEDAFPMLPAPATAALATQAIPVKLTSPQEFSLLDSWVPFANTGLRDPLPQATIAANGVPVKVAMKGYSCEVKTLDPRIPAKKKVPAFLMPQTAAVPCH